MFATDRNQRPQDIERRKPKPSWEHSIGVSELYDFADKRLANTCHEFARSLLVIDRPLGFDFLEIAKAPVTRGLVEILLPLYAATERLNSALPQEASRFFSSGFAMKERLRTPGAH